MISCDVNVAGWTGRAGCGAILVGYRIGVISLDGIGITFSSNVFFLIQFLRREIKTLYTLHTKN